MQISLVIILSIIAVILFIVKNRIKDEDLARAASIGSIISALVALIILGFFTFSPKSEDVPQETSMPKETLTLTPTLTSLPTETSTPISPETFGGLISDCIPDLYWKGSATIIPNARGCLQAPSGGLHAGDREIVILLNPKDVRESVSEAIFYPLVGDAEISFDVTLEDIKDGSDPKAPPLFSVGICNPDKIKTAHNFISYSYPGDGYVVWGILNNDESKFQKHDLYTLKTTQSFMIKIDSFDLFIEDTKTGNYLWTNSGISPGDLKAFCIRYQLPTLGTLKASISDILIIKK